MTENTEEIISDVRFITDYPEIIIDDGKVEDSIRFTKKEIRTLMQDPDFDEFGEHHADRCLMWGTCYHLKISTGEIGGMPMSIGDVNLESVTRSRGDSNGDMLSWAEKFYDNFYDIPNAPLGFGHTSEARENRDYNTDRSTADYGDE